MSHTPVIKRIQDGHEMWFLGVPSIALQYFTYQYFINTGTPNADIFLYKLEIQHF